MSSVLSLHIGTRRWTPVLAFVALGLVFAAPAAASYNYGGNARGFELAISSNADRSDSIAVDGSGTPATGGIAIFLEGPAKTKNYARWIRAVSFYVNGKFVSREFRAPYDLGGTRDGGEASLVDTAELFREGENSVRAEVLYFFGYRYDVEATLNVLPTEPTILDIAKANPDFSILVEAVEEAGLDEALSGEGALTVFAPDNAAFEQLLTDLGISKEELFADKDLLTEVLLYHVLGNALFSPAVLASDELIPLQGEPIQVDPSGKVNDSNLIAVDIAASNGVVHVIDAVLLPPSISMPQMTIAEIAASDPDFSILVEAVVETGLVGILAVEGTEITVFAPKNESFVELLDVLGLTKDELFANKALLTTVLLYHLVNEELFAEDVLAESELFPMESEALEVDADDVQVGGVDIIAPDIDASNGVIHVIDGVLVPPAAEQLLP